MATTINMADPSGCCQQYNACDVACMLENAYADLMMGKKNRAYRIGEESFTLFQPSPAQLESAIRYFQAKCNVSQGRPARRRAQICLVHGDHVCPHCRRQSCRCR